LDYVSHGAILRRMAPDRLTVVRCLRMLVEVGYLRIDRWSKYRLTPEGWADGLSRAPEDFPWGT
jgi:DNA-binding IclR family transcriptional regulator